MTLLWCLIFLDRSRCSCSMQAQVLQCMWVVKRAIYSMHFYFYSRIPKWWCWILERWQRWICVYWWGTCMQAWILSRWQLPYVWDHHGNRLLPCPTFAKQVPTMTAACVYRMQLEKERCVLLKDKRVALFRVSQIHCMVACVAVQSTKWYLESSLLLAIVYTFVGHTYTKSCFAFLLHKSSFLPMTRDRHYPLQADVVVQEAKEEEEKDKIPPVPKTKRSNKQQQQQHRRAKSTPNNMANYIKQHEIPPDPHTFGTTTAPHLIW